MQVKYLVILSALLLFFSCQPKQENTPTKKITTTSLVVLGNVQDAGSPHIACKKSCCTNLFKNPDHTRKVVSLGLIVPESNETYLFEATPDMPSQLKMLNELAPFEHNEIPDGIFLTHAHIGHYAGLMYLGKEAMNADSVLIYCLPRMKKFLENNGPWSQLVNNHNIFPYRIGPNPQSELNAKVTCNRSMRWSTYLYFNKKTDTSISVKTLVVPHRDEYSETAGYKIHGISKTALFIPDINKWEKWKTWKREQDNLNLEFANFPSYEKDILEEIKKVDYAFLDGTFYDGNELPGRDIKQIPHPFVIESMELFKDLPAADKAKIHFIHFNHTNPLLNKNSKEYKEVIKRGFNIANYGDVFEL